MIPTSNAFAMYFFIPRSGALNHDCHVPSRFRAIVLCMTKCVEALRAKQSMDQTLLGTVLSEPVIGPCCALLCFARNTLTHFVIVKWHHMTLVMSHDILYLDTVSLHLNMMSLTSM
jgi:hypothetical protein